jgi:hypothetical protein
MKIVAALTLALASACAGSSTASRDSSGATSTRLSSQSCTAPLVSSVAHKGSEIYSGPDGNSTLVGTLKSDTPVCAQSYPEGFGFRRVQFTDGRTGFVTEQSISD